MKAKTTAHNIRYTLRRSSGLAYEKTQSAFGLCAFFLRHIFAVAGNLRFPLSQLQKRRIAFTLCAIIFQRKCAASVRRRKEYDKLIVKEVVYVNAIFSLLAKKKGEYRRKRFNKKFTFR